MILLANYHIVDYPDIVDGPENFRINDKRNLSKLMLKQFWRAYLFEF